MIISNTSLFLPNDKRVGIALSGGADSSIIAYILMANLKQQLNFYTFASKEKKYATVHVTNKVIEKCIELTGNTNVTHHIKYGETQERDIFLSFLKENLKNNVDLIYTGTTNSPLIDDLESFNSKLKEDIALRRDPSIRKPVFSNGIYSPFINQNKAFIKELYEKHGLLDTLFPITRSCESTDLVSGHCEKCWWCEERIWAFNRV
jgi:7-cyano-7-deazaguanine synthase in queuosine biosynthesis